MNWKASEIVEQESDKFNCWIKESICVRLNTPTMNRDEGAYQLSPIWTQVICTPKPGGRGCLQSDFAHLSQLLRTLPHSLGFSDQQKLHKDN